MSEQKSIETTTPYADYYARRWPLIGAKLNWALMPTILSFGILPNMITMSHAHVGMGFLCLGLAARREIALWNVSPEGRKNLINARITTGVVAAGVLAGTTAVMKANGWAGTPILSSVKLGATLMVGELLWSFVASTLTK